MGIDVWVPRGGTGGDRAPDAGPGPGTPAPETDTRMAAAPDPGAPEAAIADMDWEALAAAVAGCTRCRLCEGRTRTVFGVGRWDADLLVIGEAPGAEEDRRGEPFVGRAGQLLDSMLHALGYGREEAFIANILKCRPPRNRDPEADEVAACSAYLARQMALIRPSAVLAVGRVAAQNLLHTDKPLRTLRQGVHTVDPGGIPVIVSYHPAYLLRSPLDKAKAWEDLKRLRALLPGPGEGKEGQ